MIAKKVAQVRQPGDTECDQVHRKKNIEKMNKKEFRKSKQQKHEREAAVRPYGLVTASSKFRPAFIEHQRTHLLATG